MVSGSHTRYGQWVTHFTGLVVIHQTRSVGRNQTLSVVPTLDMDYRSHTRQSQQAYTGKVQQVKHQTVSVFHQTVSVGHTLDRISRSHTRQCHLVTHQTGSVVIHQTAQQDTHQTVSIGHTLDRISSHTLYCVSRSHTRQCQ